MNYLRKPLFSFLTIGLLATACDGGTLLEAPSIVAEPVVSPAAPGIQAADPTVNTPVVEMPAPLPVEAAPVEEVPAPVVADDEDDEISEPVEAANTETTESSAAPTPTGTVDTDGDGFFADDSDSTKIDCDDTRKLVNPGMPRDCSKVTKNPANGITSVNTEDYASIDNDCDSASGTIAANIDEEGECAAATFKKGGRGNPRDGGASPSDSTAGDTPACDSTVDDQPGSCKQGEGIEPHSDVADSDKYIKTLKFESKTQDHIFAGVGTDAWNSLKIIVNFNNDKKMECKFSDAEIIKPFDNELKANTEFSFNFDMEAQLSKCSDMTPSDYQAIAQVANIKDIRIDASNYGDGGIDLGLINMYITATYSDSPSTVVKFYRNDYVYAWAQGSHPMKTYPLVKATCFADAANGGYWDYPDSTWGDGGNNDLHEDAAAKALVFSPDDKQIHITVTQQNEAFANSVDTLQVAFEGDSECKTHKSRYIELTSFLGFGDTRSFYFYTNGALTNGEISNGGKFYKIDTMGCANDDLRLSKYSISIWQNWENDDGERDHWSASSSKDFILADDCDIAGTTYDGYHGFDLTKTSEQRQ